MISWSFDELETQVYLFKKEQRGSWEDKMEDLEIDDGDEGVYYRMVKTEVKSKTVFHDKPHYVIIDQIEL